MRRGRWYYKAALEIGEACINKISDDWEECFRGMQDGASLVMASYGVLGESNDNEIVVEARMMAPRIRGELVNAGVPDMGGVLAAAISIKTIWKHVRQNYTIS
jgi:hypothetical protein